MVAAKLVVQQRGDIARGIEVLHDSPVIRGDEALRPAVGTHDGGQHTAFVPSVAPHGAIRPSDDGFAFRGRVREAYVDHPIVAMAVYAAPGLVVVIVKRVPEAIGLAGHASGRVIGEARGVAERVDVLDEQIEVVVDVAGELLRRGGVSTVDNLHEPPAIVVAQLQPLTGAIAQTNGASLGVGVDGPLGRAFSPEGRQCGASGLECAKVANTIAALEDVGPRLGPSAQSQTIVHACPAVLGQRWKIGHVTIGIHECEALLVLV